MLGAVSSGPLEIKLVHCFLKEVEQPVKDPQADMEPWDANLV